LVSAAGWRLFPSSTLAVGAPTHWSELNPPINGKEARYAFMHASLMRKRVTLGDLLIFTGWDRESLWNKIWKDCA